MSVLLTSIRAVLHWSNHLLAQSPDDIFICDVVITLAIKQARQLLKDPRYNAFYDDSLESIQLPE